ncbi:Bcr/CflA family efflux MFS transporter [Dialister hominis]|uniref:Bcr/CflA family efflux MFS transporter n=1 Tax=Dialister hominis TaxID=2582419 RepID=UPI003AB6E110
MNSLTFLTIFLGVMSAMAPLSTDMYLPSLPELSSYFSISTSMTQMTLTMTMIGMALGQIFGGPVSDRMGRKVPLFIGMGGFTIASAVCAVCTNIYVFLVFRFIMGLSGAFGIVISRAIARDVCEGPELMRFMAILMMVNGLAPIAAPVLGGQILLFTSWHGIFFVLTAVGIIQIMATMAYKETLKKTDRVRRFSDGFRAFGTLVKNRYFFGHCLVQCFVFGAFFSYIAGSSFLFQNIYHVTPAAVQLYFRRHRRGTHAGRCAAGKTGRNGARGGHAEVFHSDSSHRFLLPFGRHHCEGADLVHDSRPFRDNRPAFCHGRGFRIAGTFALR